MLLPADLPQSRGLDQPLAQQTATLHMVALLPQLCEQLQEVALAVEGSPGLVQRDCAKPLADATRQLPLLLQFCQDCNPVSFAGKKALTVRPTV